MNDVFLKGRERERETEREPSARERKRKKQKTHSFASLSQTIHQQGEAMMKVKKVRD